MPSPKTSCSECSAAILQITADITGGLCMPCSNRRKRDAERGPEWLERKLGRPVPEAPKLGPDAIIHASFFPGFATDLTSWETEITASGAVIQRIHWRRPDSSWRREEQILKGEASGAAIADLESLIAALDIAGVEQMAKETCIDDAELITLLVPSREFWGTASVYTFEFVDREHRFSDLARRGLSSFRAVWDWIESVSPYTTTRHWKESR